MRQAKEKAAHYECAAGYSYELDPSDIDEEQTEHKPDTAKIAKKIADYVRVLKPGLLISADEAIFANEFLLDLQGKFHQAEADPTLESLCSDVRRTGARAIVLVDHDPIAIDLGELSRKAQCFVLPVRGAA